MKDPSSDRQGAGSLVERTQTARSRSLLGLIKFKFVVQSYGTGPGRGRGARLTHCPGATSITVRFPPFSTT